MAIKITKTVIDRLESGERDEIYWDTEVKRFGIRVTTRGKLTFIVQGRVGGSGAVVQQIDADRASDRHDLLEPGFAPFLDARTLFGREASKLVQSAIEKGR